MNARIVSVVVACAVALLIAGCFTRPALVRQTFALEAPPSASTDGSKAKGVLAVRNVQVSPLFENRSFIYRVGPDRYDADPYAGFMVLPGSALAIPIRAFLRGAGMFKDVIEPGSDIDADTVLEIHASELYGDFRKQEELAAVLSLRFLWFSTGAAQGQKLLQQKAYVRRVPLKEQSAAALVAGWNQALAEIMKEVAADVALMH